MYSVRVPLSGSDILRGAPPFFRGYSVRVFVTSTPGIRIRTDPPRTCVTYCSKNIRHAQNMKIPVQVSNDERGEVVVYDSVGKAVLFYMSLRNEDPANVKPINRRAQVMTLCKNKRTFKGYTWGFVNDVRSSAETSPAVESVVDSTSDETDVSNTPAASSSAGHEPALELDVFTFGDEVDDIFRGNRVRLVKLGGVMTVAMIDVMKIVYPDCGSSHWSKTLRQVTERYPEVGALVSYHQFPGVGQRPTPVCNSMGFLKIVNLLDGPRAADFRHKSMQVLHRYLSGDLTLVDEIVERAESNNNPLFPTPVETNSSVVNTRVLKAPRHNGAFVGDYSNKHVVYVMSIKVEGKSFVKVGYSDKVMRRMREHCNTYDVEYVWSIVEFQECVALEAELKERLLPYNVHLTVKGKKRTEIYDDITPDIVDEILLKTRDDLGKECNQTDLEEMKSKQEARRRLVQGRLHVDVQRLEADLESARLQARIEEMDVEMASLRVQSAERMVLLAEKEMKTVELKRASEEIRGRTAEIEG